MTLKNKLKTTYLLLQNDISVEELTYIIDVFNKIKSDDFSQKELTFAIDLLSEIKLYGIRTNDLLLAVDILSEIKSDNFSDFKYLKSTVKSEQITHNVDLVDILFEIFERIIKINLYTNIDEINTNRIMSHLVSVNILSKYFDNEALTNLQSFILKYKNEFSNPDFITSSGFSQEGEDLIVERLFPPDTKGFYIDVGAHHPTRFSNTYRLYKRGWRGINIDPRPGIMKLFDKARPGDINLEAAIGYNDTDKNFANYICFKEPAYNSIYIEDIDEIKNTIYSEIVDITKVQIQSLDKILDDYSDSFTEINLLSIDVEGFEMQVLNGFSIDKYNPDVIVIEVRGFDIDARNEFEEYNYIVSSGYKLRSVLFHSLIFKKL